MRSPWPTRCLVGSMFAIPVLAATALAGAAVSPNVSSHVPLARTSNAVKLTVLATANIFGAGLSAPPAGEGGTGALPSEFALPKGTNRVLKFSSVAGKVTCCKTGSNLYNGPAGRSDFGTALSGSGGISGVQSKRSMFLAGVFLGRSVPSRRPPTKTATRDPLLGQIFFVGTGRDSSGPVEFDVPDRATRLFLGIPDGYNFNGAPGWYGDNAGAFTATFEIGTGGRRDAIFSVLAKKELKASAANPFLADASLAGAGRVADLDDDEQDGDGRGSLSLTLLWVHRDDAHLVLRPHKTWDFFTTPSVHGRAEVVKSDEPRCPRGAEVSIRLSQGPDRATVAPSEGCRSLPVLVWREPASTLAVKVTRVRVN